MLIKEGCHLFRSYRALCRPLYPQSFLRDLLARPPTTRRHKSRVHLHAHKRILAKSPGYRPHNNLGC